MQGTLKLPTFLRWAGGKRQILPKLTEYFPEKAERYFEPFLGGGSVFFYVKQKYNPVECIISDTNPDLINAYVHVRDEPRKLIKSLKHFKTRNSEEFYYSTRKKFNKFKFNGIERSAAFIYLNKTCFNGLYRVNSRNEFNVPYGQLRKPSIFDELVIYTASELLRDRVKIVCQDYARIEQQVRRGDFVYLDPCYDPLKKTSFASYTPERFSVRDRKRLYNFIEILKNHGAKVVLSNNDIPEVRQLYSKYHIGKISAPRYIGSKVAYRSDVTELVISSS